MNIQQDIRNFLERTGWSAYRLARESGVNKDVIYRLVRGDRQGANSRTIERLWPFLYSEHQSEQQKPT